MNCSAGWKRRWRHCCPQSSGPFVDGVCGKLPVNIWNLPEYPFADWRTDSRCVERKLTLGIVRSCRFNCSARSSYKLQRQMLRWSRHWRVYCLFACLPAWLVACLTKLNWTELTETEVCRLARLSTARLPVGLLLELVQWIILTTVHEVCSSKALGSGNYIEFDFTRW
jgi:hypothetical protein